jgi:hypothetical protein
MVPETRRHYFPDGMARRAGSQIPAGAEIAVVKFLPKRRAIIEYEGKTVHDLFSMLPEDRIRT